MSMIDHGTQGAKRQAMTHDPLLKIARDVLENVKPGDEPRGLQYARMFQDAINEHEDSADLTESVFAYMWAILVNRATKEAPSPEEREAGKIARKNRVEAAKRVITQNIDARAHQMFLDMMMPNGKALRECTGNDLRKMEPRIAKTMKHLAKTLKPRQKVGDIYTTNEELLAAAKA